MSTELWTKIAGERKTYVTEESTLSHTVRHDRTTDCPYCGGSIPTTRWTAHKDNGFEGETTHWTFKHEDCGARLTVFND